MTDTYDIAIIGAGVAGAFAAYRIVTNYKNVNAIIFDIGSRPGKRKSQTNGFLGCLPSSDGKLFMNNIDDCANLLGSKESKRSYKEFANIMKQVCSMKKNKNSEMKKELQDEIKSLGYNITDNNFIQILPKDSHSLSRHMAEAFHDCEMSFGFDHEILNLEKVNNEFILYVEDENGNNIEIKAKKVILAVGRSGWRWTNELYKKFGIIKNNDFSKVGIRVEMSADLLKDFNKSSVTLTKDNIEIGPLSWNGTVIPEDHYDLVISSFRSNENRWFSDKVSFNIINKRFIKNSGVEETDRLGRLTYIIANDRIMKEKISLFLNDKSKISIIPEYSWIKEVIPSLTFLPEIKDKGYLYAPTLTPMVSDIDLSKSLETNVSGMYAIGESAGVMGIVSAAITGISCVDSICGG